MLRAAGALAVLAALGCTPYTPPCRIETPRVIDDTHGRLVAHAGGRVSWLDLRRGTATDAGVPQTLIVTSLSSDGQQVQPPYSVELPPAASFLESLTAEPVDFPGGAALARRRLLPADAGAAVVVDLRRADGGARTATFPVASSGLFLPPDLSQAGDSLLQLNPGGGADLVALDFDGATVATRALAGGESVRGGPDALALTPGPVLLSPSLAPLSTPPEPWVSGDAIAWDLDAGRITLASVKDGDLLVERLELGGLRRPMVRVSSGAFVLGLAAGARGTGVVFGAPFGGDDGGFGLIQLWFAFVDHEGKKRGPDVPLPFELNGFGSAPLLVPNGPQGFTLFMPGADGLQAVPVSCDGVAP